jgi:3-oxoacyl-[acyl-carrier protein] reductase
MTAPRPSERCGTGRVAVVTGGGRGIGAAISRRLAADGHTVVINYSKSVDDARNLVEYIKKTGGRAEAIGGDVSDPAAVTSLFDEAGARFGPPTIVVNNAGVSAKASARQQSVEQWDRLIAVNLSAAFYCTDAALGGMYEADWGRVVFVGSPGGGRTIGAGMSAYSAAKAGLVAMGRCIALETAHRGVTVNTVVPGFVETDMTRSAGDTVLDGLRSRWPEVPADAVASTVSFLCSEEAAFVSGEDIAVWLGGPAPFARPSAMT